MEVEREFGDQVQFIGVPGLSSDEESKASFLDTTGANTFPTFTNGDVIWERFGVGSQGTFVFVNDDGTWTSKRRSGSLREDVEALIAQ